MRQGAQRSIVAVLLQRTYTAHQWHQLSHLELACCRVYVRVKPLSAEEVAVGQTSVLKCHDGHRVQCTALGSTKVAALWL